MRINVCPATNGLNSILLRARRDSVRRSSKGGRGRRRCVPAGFVAPAHTERSLEELLVFFERPLGEIDELQRDHALHVQVVLLGAALKGEGALDPDRLAELEDNVQPHGQHVVLGDHDRQRKIGLDVAGEDVLLTRSLSRTARFALSRDDDGVGVRGIVTVTVRVAVRVALQLVRRLHDHFACDDGDIGCGDLVEALGDLRLLLGRLLGRGLASRHWARGR